MSQLPEYVDGLLNVSGSERLIEEALRDSRRQPVFINRSGIDFGRINSAFAIALHMHQPLIPAGGSDLRTAEIISNLKYMMDNQGIGDNHNAPVFVWCYKRMGELIPQLVEEGKQPRAMLEYSGTLLHGMRQMGLHDVFDAPKPDRLRSPLLAYRGMARLPLGACGRSLDAGAGLPAAR
jgi:hypothetical protein